MEFSFILKKIITVGLMPLTIGVVLAVIALWFMYRENLKKAKIYLSLSVLWLFLISYAPFANLIIEPLEKVYPKLETIPDNVEYMLLLGGDRERRTWEALRLYQKAPNVKIITSGFAMHGDVTAAEKTAKTLEESGVNKENILTQGKAKDTHEEATYIRERLGNKPFILVTAAYHMPRSMIIFQKQGLKPIAAPADFNNPDEDSVFTMLNADQLNKTEHALHEYIGLLWIQLKSLIR